MPELVFLKLGGSLVTDKTRPQTLRADVLVRLAEEIASALAVRPDLSLLLGHGSGSFGHVAAQKYGTRAGVHSPQQWRGYAEVARVAAELNGIVVGALWDAGVPALRIQPSASARCREGELLFLAERPLVAGLEQGLIPVVYGDVALDEVLGGTIISTEEIFAYLASRLGPARIILAGEVDGVLTVDPSSGPTGEVVETISPETLPGLLQALGGSRGVDVTGGMAAKVQEMLALARSVSTLRAIHVVSGVAPGVLRQVLVRPDVRVGTRIVAR